MVRLMPHNFNSILVQKVEFNSITRLVNFKFTIIFCIGRTKLFHFPGPLPRND